MSKATPGPWRLCRIDAGTCFVTEDRVGRGEAIPAYNRKIAEIPDWPDAYAEKMSNAALIAAAPDLLEALKYGRDTFGHDGGCLPELRPLIGDAPCARCMFDVAIAKAEGRDR